MAKRDVVVDGEYTARTERDDGWCRVKALAVGMLLICTATTIISATVDRRGRKPLFEKSLEQPILLLIRGKILTMATH